VAKFENKAGDVRRDWSEKKATNCGTPENLEAVGLRET